MLSFQYITRQILDFLAIFCLQCTGLTSVHRFVKFCLYKFYGVFHCYFKQHSKILFSSCLLLASRNRIDFCILALYLVNLMISLIRVSGFLQVPQNHLCTQSWLSAKGIASLLLFQSICLLLILFHALLYQLGHSVVQCLIKVECICALFFILEENCL